MRRSGRPAIAGKDDTYVELNRVTFSDSRIAEDYLQRALDRMPGILPVEEIDSSFAPIVSLGREVDNIDNLYISPEGRITLVETKLYRNPEAVREVVAQVLDYAMRISKWTYEEFESRLQHAQAPARVGPDGLYNYVAKHFPDEIIPEQKFIDEVQKNLRDARFLLLVVGDGIRENLEMLLGHLHRSPQMLYRFALVEVQIYENPEALDGRLIIPLVVAKTTEVVRAVVRVQTEGPATVDVSVEDDEVVRRSADRRTTLSEDEFYGAIKSDEVRKVYRRLLIFADELGLQTAWRASSVAVHLPDPAGSGQNLSLFYMQTNGIVGTGWLGDQLKKISLSKEIDAAMIQRLQQHFKTRSQKNNPENISLNESAEVIGQKMDYFTQIIRSTVDEIREASKRLNAGQISGP